MNHGSSDQPWLTVPEMVRDAQLSMDPSVWDYSAGGSDDEVTLRRNRHAFERVTFNPRILSGVGTPDVTGALLGHTLQLPLLFAPVGSIAQFHPDGALACAQAASQAGIASGVATLSSPSLETLRTGSDCPLFFQMYMYGDREWAAALVRRVEDAGYSAICLTADVAAYGRRERDLHNRFFPRDSVERPNIEIPLGSSNLLLNDEFNALFSWDDMAWLRTQTNLPIMVKGVLNGTDAALAVSHGVDVVYVSNHGGRQLDHAPSTIEVLPEIVEAVAGQAEIVVDSGFQRGTDIVKALALGADAVAVGKLTVWALAAGGVLGLVRLTELLHAEVRVAMANLGARTTDVLSQETLRTPSRLMI